MWEDERKRLVRVPRRATHGDDDYDDYDDEDDNDEEQGYGGNGRSSSGRGGYGRVGKVVDDEEDEFGEEGCLWWFCCSCFKWQRVCGVMCGLVILAALLYALLDASDLLPCGDKCLPAMGNLGPLYQRAVNAAQQQMGGETAFPSAADGAAVGAEGGIGEAGSAAAAYAQQQQQQPSQSDALPYQPEQQQQQQLQQQLEQQQQSMVHFEPQDSALLVPHTQPVEQQQQQQQQQQQEEAPELPQEPPLDMPFVPPQNPPLTPLQEPDGSSEAGTDAKPQDLPDWSAVAAQEAEGDAEEAMAAGGETGVNLAQTEAQQVRSAEGQQQPPAAQWGADSAQGGAETWGAEVGVGAAEDIRGAAAAEVDGNAEESRGYSTAAGNAEVEGQVAAERQVEADGFVAAAGQMVAERQVPPQSQGVIAEGAVAQEVQEDRARTGRPGAPVDAGAAEAVGGPAAKTAGTAGQAELQGELEAGGGAQIPDTRTGSGNATGASAATAVTGATDVPASVSVAGTKAAATSSVPGVAASTASSPASATAVATVPAATAAKAAATASAATSATAAVTASATSPATTAGASQTSGFGHVAGGVQQLQAEGEARARAEQQRKKGEGKANDAAQGDEVPDDAMAADFRACIEPGKLADMAAQSSWPYLALLGVRPGFTRQQEALLRGLWAAKATGSVLLLPPFFLSFDSGGMKQTKLQQYLDTDRLVTHMYCSSKSWAVDHLPASIVASLPANATAANMPALVQALGPAAQRIPSKVVAALSAGGGGGGGGGGDAASVIAAWSEKMRDDAAAGKVKLILLDADTPIPFTSRDQQHLRRNGLAAMRPAQPIASLSAHLLHLLRKTHEAQFGELVGFSFAVVHINPDSLAEASAFAAAPGGGSGILGNSSSGNSSSGGSSGGSSTDRLLSVLLAVLNPAHTLLYVTIGDTPQRAAILNRLTSASFHITTRDALLRSDRSAATSDAQRFLSALHPEHEMQAAVEQAVAREAAVFFGPAESSFSSLVFELRCFTHPPLLEGGEGVAMRATVFYDVGPSAVPCRA
ncbi:unnamed protein product [Closterium sp. NIES-54]